MPAEEAPALRQDIANHHRFEQLCRQLAQLNIEHTRALRATEAASATGRERAAAKKNSPKSASPKGTAKPRPSSIRRGRASRGKA